MHGRTLAALLLLAWPAGCARPPTSAYIGSHNPAAVTLGNNAVGEACTQDTGAGAREAAIFCGSWDQPAAHILGGDPAASASLVGLATASPWRNGLDRRVACQTDPVHVDILGQPALLLRCTRRVGGWPHVAVVTILDGHAWYADGVEPALPVIERSIGLLSGRLPASAATVQADNPSLAARRLASAAFSASDVGQYGTWMRDATSANRAGSYDDAERAYRSVAELQRRVLGRDSPALSRTLASQALQASDLGRYGEADRLLDDAERRARAPDQTDENATALVLHYRGLHLLNEGRAEPALASLRQAEAAYTVNLGGAPLVAATGGIAASAANGVENAIATRDLLSDPTTRGAIVGVIETRRAEAVALERLHRQPESEAAAASARAVAEANAVDAPGATARLLRTSAFVAEAGGRKQEALAWLRTSADAFAVAHPDSPVYARTALLLARREADAGNQTQALAICRGGIAALRAAKLGADPALLLPCLKLLADAATGPHADAVAAEMFEAAELAQGSVTSALIARASVRLGENSRDPRVGRLIREREDLVAQLDDLTSQRQTTTPDEAPAARLPSAGGTAGQAEDRALEARIARVRSALREHDSALQAASPKYNSLVQGVVGAAELLAVLRPGEAFCSIMLGPDEGWSFLLRDGHIAFQPIAGGSRRMTALVARVRSSLDTETMPPPPFDTAAAAELYQGLLGGFEDRLHGATALTVAPTGPLLSLPFGLLLTGPARPDALADAPWLVRRLVLSHVPAPANFVELRKLEGTSRAAAPWFGFGDFRPVTRTQAEASFPPASCGDSAKLLTALPPLPGAQRELESVRAMTHAPASDQLLGGRFTADAVRHQDLQDFRILHFATHALLASDLKCQTEPALVTSAPPNAPSAAAALLTASEVAQLGLDADTVILSACNSGGAGGTGAGESLSGLARSFFYAGARSLLVTHWDVNDRVTAYLVALTIAEAKSHPELGISGGLAAAQRRMLDDAKGDLAAQAHPFYWAPLALVGDGLAGGVGVQAGI